MKLSLHHATAFRAFFLVLLLTPLAIGAPAQRGLAAPAAQTEPAPSSEVTPDVSDAPADASLLDDAELAALAAMDEQPSDEVTGGALSNEHLTYVAIALAAAVLVLVLK